MSKGPINNNDDIKYNLDLIKYKATNKFKSYLSPYSNMYSMFYINRNLFEYNYSPIFYTITDSKDTVKIVKHNLKRYIDDETKDEEILDISIYKIDEELYNKFDKDKFYYITLDSCYKDESDIFINVEDIKDINDDSFFILNLFLLNLRDKVKGYMLIIRDETYKKYFNLFIRSYFDLLFIDKYYKNFFDYSILVIPTKFLVEIEFNNNILCIDRTDTNNEFKLIINN
jgi:hypothetical protein